MKNLLILFALLLASVTAKAQFYYGFTQYQSTYTEITDGTAATTAAWDDPTFNIPIGFAFTYFGAPYTEIYSDEEIGLGAMLGFKIPGSKIPFLIVDGNDIVDRGFVVGQHLSPITYKTLGPPGNQVLIIQWKNAGFLGDLDDDDISVDFTNFQLWLHQATGVIEIRYGPNSITQSSSLDGQGPIVGLLKWLNLTNGTNSPDSRLLVGPLANPNFVNFDFGLQSIVGIPTSGTVFKFDKALSENAAPLADAGLQLVPNPANESFSVVSLDNQMPEMQILVFDLIGRLVIQANDPHQIPVKSLAAGTYTVQIRSKEGIFSGQLVKI
jgi:Secretion system C-terminal sorting domain